MPAISFVPFVSETATANLGAASAIPAILNDNTKTLVILNLDSTNALWVKCDVAAPAPAAIAAATSTVIPAGSAFTFDIGPVGERGVPGTSNYNIYIQSAGGGAVSVNITAINTNGFLKTQG